jgi:hypothetical protein
VEVLFEENNNSISEIAWAFTVYSLVPYIGILFVPFAVMCGILGLYFYRKTPQIGGRKLSVTSLISSIIILFVHILLWYLLFLIPELARNF